MRHFFKKLTAILLPEATSVSWLERIRSVLGVVLGLLAVAALGLLLASYGNTSPWIVASMGASAFLLFVLPSSPMAQPWAVIGGSCISAFVGVACSQFVHELLLLIPLSVGLAILAMFTLRCLHAPAAALALLIPLNGLTDFHFVLFPVLGNAVLLVLCAVIYNSLTGKPYPQRPKAALDSSPLQKRNRKIEDQEISAVLERYNQVLDISKDDLANLISQVEHGAYQKKLQSMLCKNIMTTDVMYVSMDSPLDQAWNLLRKRHVKALPVIDGARRVLGIITLEDFLKSAAVDFHQTFGQRIRGFMRTAVPGLNSLPNAVGQVMSKPVRVISEDRNMLDLAEIFCGDGHHHIPVINDNRQLVGMITQSDFVKAIDQSIDIR
ncbi:HPP family protein [Polynucleobacter yangtzensis]|uniref:HPP family protein n=1 Tax=Polynucleobacter yangtzensis TaxID=1743159 RepID=UPI0008333D20|nr:HPP family protein [Polynucleobacter yangtzensis]